MFESFIKFLQKSKKNVLLILIVALTTIILSTVVSMLLSRIDNYHIPSLGTIRTTGVKAYGGDITLDEKGEQQINWGMIYPGTLTDRSFYVQSESNIDITLDLTASNWTFLDSEHRDVTVALDSYLNPDLAMNLTWNYNGTLIRPNVQIYVTLTLQASSDTSFINFLIDKKVTEFSFDIHIRSQE